MTDHKRPSAQATAALMDLIGRGQAMQAAIIRGDAEGEIERLRQEAMSVAEAYLDRTAEAAQIVRSMVDGHPDAERLRQEEAKRLQR